MKTLALLNQKGGCGKTTTAVNLAGALAARGERALLIDLDPQAHATLALSVAVEEGERSIADVLLRGTGLRAALRKTPGGITLVPATLELSELEESAVRTLHPERLLAQALADVEADFDFAVLDCPPRADGVLAANALRAADVAVLVVEMSAFALQGAVKTLGVFEELVLDTPRSRAASIEELPPGDDARPEVRVVGTLFDRRTELARELLVGAQARFGARLFDTVIHQSARLRQAAACGVPVQVLDHDCRAARDFEALAEEVCALAPGRELVGAV